MEKNKIWKLIYGVYEKILVILIEILLLVEILVVA